MTDPTFWNLTSTAWTAVTAIATVALVVAGVVTAIAAFRQLRSSRDTWRDEHRAYVWVDFQSNPTHPNIIEFVICNSGRTTATNVELIWNQRPVSSLGGNDFADARMFTDGIPLLTPGRTIRTTFDSTFERLREGTTFTNSYIVTVRYSDAFKRRHDEQCLLDVETLKGTSYIGTKSLHHAAKALEEIQKVVARSGMGKRDGLQVTVQTSAEATARDRRQFARLESMTSLQSPRQILRARRPKTRQR
jgi:hypothetical protein